MHSGNLSELSCCSNKSQSIQTFLPSTPLLRKGPAHLRWQSRARLCQHGILTAKLNEGDKDTSQHLALNAAFCFFRDLDRHLCDFLSRCFPEGSAIQLTQPHVKPPACLWGTSEPTNQKYPADREPSLGSRNKLGY